MRPHEALGGKTPSELYRAGKKTSLVARPFTYPAHFIPRTTTDKGMFKLEEQHYRASRSLVKQRIALEPIDALHCRLWFRELDLGLISVVPPARWLAELVERHAQKQRTQRGNADRKKTTERRPKPRSAAANIQHLSGVAA